MLWSRRDLVMKKMILIVAAMVAAIVLYVCWPDNDPVSVLAQVSNPPIYTVITAPSGACAAGLPNQQVYSTGVQYSCQNVTGSTGTWGAFSTGSATGTVTGVSVATANGVSGTVANATTTPAITLT